MLDQIEKHLPELKRFLAKTVVGNEKTLKVALAKGHSMLPFYVRAIVSEDVFVNFCIENKHVLFGTASPEKSRRKVKSRTGTNKKTNTNRRNKKQ
jgi:hypothetical protein